MILIIEDEKDTRAMIELLLKKAGYRTMAVADRIEALLTMGKHPFDLVLSDINMPNLDGLTLLTMSKQKGLTTPVIFLTADSDTGQEQKSLELGAIDYITKPIKKEVLLLRVKRAARYRTPPVPCPAGAAEGPLARIIHDGSSRNRQALLRERCAEPGGPEVYSCSTSRDQGASPPTEGLSEQRIGDCSRSAHE